MVSRVAKNPVTVPAGVEIKITGSDITVKGKNGQLQQSIHSDVVMAQEDSSLTFRPAKDGIAPNALSGTMRALVANMVIGVTEGFEKKLQLVGVGYRAKAQGQSLNLSVGFSHPVNVKMPDGITVETPSNTEIVLKGADKQKVSQVAANIRSIRPPEPYKGKGIRYFDEVIIKKEGKKK